MKRPVKDPLKPVYLLAKKPLPKEHFIYKFVDPNVMYGFGDYAEVRGNIMLRRGVHNFEHLRVGLVDYCPGQMWWSADGTLNSDKPFSTPSLPWLDANKMSLFSSADDIPKGTYSPFMLDSRDRDIDYGAIPALDITGTSDSFPIPNYPGASQIEQLDFNYWNHFQRARLNVEESLLKAAKLGDFDRILTKLPKLMAPLLVPTQGGTFLQNINVKGTYRGRTCERFAATNTQPMLELKTLEKCISETFDTKEFDNNFAIHSDNADMYNRFGEASNNGATILGELPEVFETAADIIKFGVCLISPAKWPRAFSQMRKCFGHVWLGYNFGVAPTISDIEKMLKSLAQIEKKAVIPPVVSKIRYSVSPVPLLTNDRFGDFWGRLPTTLGYLGADPTEFISPVIDGATIAPLQSEYRYGAENTLTAYYVRPCAYQRQKIYVPEDKYREFLRKSASPGTTALSAQSVLRDWSIYTSGARSFATLVETVWELIPFSWLIDYFINIKDFVNFIDRAEDPLLSLVEGSSVRFAGVEIGVDHFASDRDLLKDTDRRVLLPIAHIGIREYRRQRSCSVNYTMPKIRLNTPSLKQMFNIGALLGSMNHKR